jgi:hypothetical protein
MKGFLAILIFLVSIDVFALQAFEERDFTVIDQKIRELGAQYGEGKVLVVYDLDNTLLAMNSDLGSDQWYDWQAAMLKAPETAHDLVAKDGSGLLTVQGLLYAVGKMRLTQPELPAMFESLAKDGYRQILLTSRGPDFRDSTEREILRNGLAVFDPKKKENIFYGMPYDLKSLHKSCLTDDDKANFKLGEPRPISIGHGIILSSGQHKGAILKTFLCDQKSYKAIVFADDKQKNVDAMVAAYGANPNTELVVFRYTREDERVKSFVEGDKAQAIMDWQTLSASLNTIFASGF